MDRLFRRSALVRQKYLDRPYYQHKTITNACGWTTGVYSRTHLSDVSPSYDVKDIRNARLFADANRDHLLFIDETNDVLKFTEGGWVHAEIGDAENAAKDVVANDYNQSLALFKEDADSTKAKALLKHVNYSSTLPRIQAMIELSKSEVGMTVRLSDFDADPWVLGVQNGVLDLRKGELQPVSPGTLVSKRANVIYDPEATCPQFEKFLSAVQLDPNVRRLLQQLVGMWLCGKPNPQKLIFFYGLGANGKTTFIEVMAWLLGEYSKVIATEMLMQHQRSPQGPSPDIVALKGRRLVYCNEVEEGRRLAEARVKQLTGGDTLSGRVPYAKSDISFQPSHKLVMIGNHKPEIRGVDNGIWRRMMLIPFDQVIPAHYQDENLLDKLKQEGPGVLNWALAGLSDYRNNGLSIPAIISGATDAYRTDQDIIGECISDYCNVIAGASTDKGTLYKAYESWAKEHGHRACSQTKFTQRLIDRGYRLDAGRRKWCTLELNPEGLRASTSNTGVR